jgi:hypothetical protein
MKKFQANYLISDKGNLLKNGIVVAEDDGAILQYIDVSDDLIELAGTSFHNGILIAAFCFSKFHSSDQMRDSDHPIISLVMKLVEGKTNLSIQDFVELAKQIQEEFAEMKIPEILKEISDALILNVGFIKVDIPGIFLLTGVDLPQLRFKKSTKLRRIL